MPECNLKFSDPDVCALRTYPMQVFQDSGRKILSLLYFCKQERTVKSCVNIRQWKDPLKFEVSGRQCLQKDNFTGQGRQENRSENFIDNLQLKRTGHKVSELKNNLKVLYI